MIHPIQAILLNAATDVAKTIAITPQDLRKEDHEVNAGFGAKEDVIEETAAGTLILKYANSKINAVITKPVFISTTVSRRLF